MLEMMLKFGDYELDSVLYWKFGVAWLVNFANSCDQLRSVEMFVDIEKCLRVWQIGI